MRSLPARIAVIISVATIATTALAVPAEAARKPKPKKSPRPAATAPAVVEIASTVPGCMNLSTDMGRPVCEIALALGVPAGVFREAFTHVTPAAKGAEPSDEQREANHQALLTRLSPYGVTPELLDSVSDRYRL
ncbi:MAG: hypothetical protein RJB01_1129 [Actinomycetota bacterium]|jgi:hypothetical protein